MIPEKPISGKQSAGSHKSPDEVETVKELEHISSAAEISSIVVSKDSANNKKYLFIQDSNLIINPVMVRRYTFGQASRKRFAGELLKLQQLPIVWPEMHFSLATKLKSLMLILSIN